MKRVERSFAYRGVLTMLVGAVVCIPGAVMQWWPNLFGLENSRNVRPMIVKISFGTGILLAAIGLGYVLWCAARWGLYRRARKKGKQVKASLLCVEADYSRLSRGKPAYVVRCLYTDENGKTYLFRSPPLRRDPTRRLNPQIEVWCDEADYTRHYVDVGASTKPYRLPKNKQ